MEEDLKTNTELMKKLSEARTLISIGEKQLLLNEMSIGRARDFGIEVVKLVDELSALSGKDVTEMEMAVMLREYGDVIFKLLTKILNWVFCYKNSDYIKLSIKWVTDNMTIRIITEIVTEIARQNKMDWLIPFFQDRFQTALKVVKS